jgi:hypothetical protein
MKKSPIRSLAVLAIAGLALAAAAVAAQEQEQGTEKEKPKELARFTGYIRIVQGSMTGKSIRATMSVEHWTTDEERAALLKALSEGGSDALLAAMRKTIVGYFWTTSTTRYPLNIASSFQTEKGRLVRLVTERPIQFAEFAASTPRSRDYEFGVIEMLLDEKDTGEGTVIMTAKVNINKDGQIEVESLGTTPQPLINVKQEKIKD